MGLQSWNRHSVLGFSRETELIGSRDRERGRDRGGERKKGGREGEGEKGREGGREEGRKEGRKTKGRRKGKQGKGRKWKGRRSRSPIYLSIMIMEAGESKICRVDVLVQRPSDRKTRYYSLVISHKYK